MATIVNSTTFNHFAAGGKVSYVKTSTFDSNACQHIISDIAVDDNKQDIFNKLCEMILTSNTDFNIVMLHNLIYHMTNHNPELVNELIIKMFNNVTNDIANKLDSAIKDNTFTISLFIEIYKIYYLRSSKLSKFLSYFDDRVNANNQNKYSYIGLIRSYTFYANVINKKYDSCYLYQIFTKQIENNSGSMEEISQLFKMYSYYIKLSNISSLTKINKDALFNSELNNLFLVTLGPNQMFIRTLTQYIHDNIKSLVENENEQIENNIAELISLVANHFVERDLFNMYYEKLLEVRLKNPNCKLDIERKFIDKFKKPADNKIIQNMLYKITDIQEMIGFKNIYLNATITITSDKFKNKVNASTLDRNKVDGKLFRHGAWSHSKTNTIDILPMNIPFELEPNIAIYNKLYEKRYPHREIMWNFSNGTSVISLTLNNKVYHIELTTSQLFLLLQFNEHKSITAVDLASNLGIPLSKLGLILQTLIKAKILKREIDKKSNDPSMLISLNHDFSHPSDKITIVSLMQQPEQLQQQMQDTEINEKFAINRETFLQACIVRTMKRNKNMTYIALFNETKISIPFPLEETKFTKCLDSCINEKFIEKTNDGYNYID